MRKKFIYIFFIFIILVGNFVNNVKVLAISEDDEDFDEAWIYEAKNEVTEEKPSIQSKNVVAIDRESKKILFSKNENEKVPMASTTKIMTAIIAIENIDNFDEVVKVDKEAATTQGSRLGLTTGASISYNDLLYGLLLCSGNDAAVQLAISISGSVQEFAKLMNYKAYELGLVSTHFVTPHGLDEEGHVTTAYELAKLTDYALSIEKFAKIVSTTMYTVMINGYSKQIGNTNELLGYLEGVNGVKTGYTSGAGRCLVTSTLRDNFNIIVVVLGADTKKIRTKDSIKIIEYCYRTYKMIDLEELVQENYNSWCDINKKRITIYKGVTNSIFLKINENMCKKYPVNSTDDISIDINAKLNLKAPVYQNEKIGELVIKENQKSIFKIDILTDSDVAKKGIQIYFKEILLQY